MPCPLYPCFRLKLLEKPYRKFIEKKYCLSDEKWKECPIMKGYLIKVPLELEKHMPVVSNYLETLKTTGVVA